jgi:DNA-binding response OmpR family regulator
MKSAAKHILIVDNDLGFICWLGSVLTAAGYRSWPACSTSEAISLSTRKPLARLDLLIVNASLPGVSELIAHFRRAHSRLKVMALGPQAETLAGVHAWHPTPGLSDDSAREEWVRAVRQASGRQNRAA